MNILLAYPWPGNVRELQNAIEYAFVLCQGEAIEPEHLPPKALSRTGAVSAPPLDHPAPGLSEKERLIQALRQTQGNQSEAARLLVTNQAVNIFLDAQVKCLVLPAGTVDPLSGRIQSYTLITLPRREANKAMQFKAGSLVLKVI